MTNLHFADAAWDPGSVVVYTDDCPDRQIAGGVLAWVDPDDDSTEADSRRNSVIVQALAAMGWEPIPGEEWDHVEGGLGNEAGAERVPVRPLEATQRGLR